MSKTNLLDRSILAVLVTAQAPTQTELASTLKVTTSTIAQSLTKLQRLGLVDLTHAGQRRIPKLRLFGLLEQIQFAVSHLQAAIGGAYE